MTEIPMPQEISDDKDEEDKDCCDRICECWCQICGVLILIGATIAIISAFFA
ncbi:MAG: hypothetical protein GF411_16595 [Candidatus Lokiarchaeota archaeon]|nr:hypothetical protein [Candidatus Lokiarchaeota archaeon]